jgi:HopA1 effector protein family
VSETRGLVAEAVEATRIHTTTRYSWFGRMSPRLPARIVGGLTVRAARDYLVHTLAGQLYGDFYLRGRAEPAQWSVPGPASARRAFEAALSSANSGQGYLQDGWEVQAVAGPVVVVSRGDLELRVVREELVTPDGDPPRAGQRVRLRMPKELLRIAPGFYTACGDLPLESTAADPPVRLYWHLSAPGAVAFVRGATARLNAARIPFRLKVLHDPHEFRRCDAAVVYLADRSPWTGPLLGLHADLAPHMLPRTPVFAEPLAPGLARAVDPGTGESFGQHRCRLLADALVTAHEEGARGVAATMAVVERRFAADGVDLDAAHVRRGAPAAPVGVP